MPKPEVSTHMISFIFLKRTFQKTFTTLRGLLNFTKAKLDTLIYQIGQRPIASLNYSLIIALLLLILLIIRTELYSDTEYYSRNSDNNKVEKFPTFGITKTKPLQYYIAGLTNSNLLRSVDSDRYKRTNVHQQTNYPEPKDVIQKLQLMGIIFGNNPEAIIKTPEFEQPRHYRIGDRVNGILIKDILKSKIVLIVSSEEYYLTL